MLNRSASLAMSTSVLKALPVKLDIKRHSPSILYFCNNVCFCKLSFCLRFLKSYFSLKYGINVEHDEGYCVSPAYFFFYLFVHFVRYFFMSVIVIVHISWEVPFEKFST